jgi:hypothetical protein
VNPKPLAFAMMANGELEFQVTHGFSQLALKSEGHPLDGVLGCFLGDHTATTLNGNTIVWDPEFVVTFHDKKFVVQVPVRQAADSSIKKMEVDSFIKEITRGGEVVMPMCLPLPLA